MEQGQIKGVYSSNKDGVEYVTKNGNPFLKVMVVVGDKAYYDAFFFTPAAHFRFEGLFRACGRVAPTHEDIIFKDVEDLIGTNVLVRVGKDKRGYDCINLYKPILPEEEVKPEHRNIADIGDGNAANPPEEKEDDSDDPDLLENVPF